MASTRAVNAFTGVLPRNIASPLRATIRLQTPKNNITSRRFYSDIPSTKPKREKTTYTTTATATITTLVLAGGSYYLYHNCKATPETPQHPHFHLKKGSAGQSPGLINPTPDEYQKIYDAIAKRLRDEDDYDDGSYGPVLLRLAWHASGTYDAETGSGVSNGATMRFAPENDHGANSGLKNARDFLDPIKEQFPWISYSDLWTLAGVCAIQEMQGPTIPWRPGRQDRDGSHCTPDGRLPDGAKEQNHLRAVFGRMGFNDQEIVALSGAHALGRCHSSRSGFEGPWTFSPTVLTNEYYKLLVDEKWHFRDWKGPRQYQDGSTKTLMMLPTDMALVKDAKFNKYVEEYAKDGDKFFRDFSDVVCKLFELGVPFKDDRQERLRLRILDDAGQ